MGDHDKRLHSKVSLSVTRQGDLPHYYSGHCLFLWSRKLSKYPNVSSEKGQCVLVKNSTLRRGGDRLMHQQARCPQGPSVCTSGPAGQVGRKIWGECFWWPGTVERTYSPGIAMSLHWPGAPVMVWGSRLPKPWGQGNWVPNWMKD